jgi:hypothetical protein
MATINGTFNSLIAGTLSGTVATPGATGPAGPAGPAGPQGIPGVGVPAGGLTGQILSKSSNLDYSTAWTTISLSDYLTKSGNLAGLTDLAVARDNLNLGSLNTPTFAGLTLQGSGANVGQYTPTSLSLTHTTLGSFVISPSSGITFPDTSVQTTAFPAGSDMPTGGLTGQALVKVSNSNYDADWATITSGATWGSITGTLSSQTDLQTALNLKSPLASPAFTGTPTAPTPSPGTDSTQIATTAWVKNFDYAQTNSPQFTGNPRSVTPSLSDDDTSIATTAFVKGQNYLTSSALSGYALLSGATFSGKVNFTSVSGASGLNVGIGGTAVSSPTAGDLWIATSGSILNYRDGAAVHRLVAVQNLTNTFSSPQIIDTTNASAALRVTQKGTGNAIQVEDSTTPDSTPFVVDQFGKVGIGVVPDTTAALKVDTNGIMFGDGTTQTTAASGGGAVAWGSITGTLADQIDLGNEFNTKANVSGETFTGAVNVPTPAAIANDNQVINRAFSEQFLGFSWADLVSTSVSNISFGITGSSPEEPAAFDQYIYFDFCCPGGFNNIRPIDGSYPIIIFGIFLSGVYQGGWDVTSSLINATSNFRVYNTSFAYGNCYDVYAQVILNAASPFPYQVSRFKIASFCV